MTTRYNGRNPRSRGALLEADTASLIEAELLEYGLPKDPALYHYLKDLIAKHGKDDVRIAVTKAVDRYTEDAEGGDSAAREMTSTEYVMYRLKQHKWNRNNHR